MVDSKIFANQLIEWYHHHHRDLPWRKTQDSYAIWLSEIILQQTRVVQGLPYYESFLRNYPTVNDLAAASETEVLRLWQGLGYYSRARNLHACAKMVVEQYGGEFPGTFDELIKLKGIGRYTAAAIASFAFNQPNAVVDGNVYRVLSRVYGIETDISLSSAPKVFETKAQQLLDKKRPASFNQAIMEFGAIQCTPKSPACGICPFSASCFAFNCNMIDSLPVKSKKVKVRKRYFTYLVFQFKDELWLRQRGAKDVWQGLYDFYLIETEGKTTIDSVLESTKVKALPAAVIAEESKIYEHVLTHQRIFANFVKIEVHDSEIGQVKQLFPELEKHSIEQIKNLPKPVLISKYLEDFIF